MKFPEGFSEVLEVELISASIEETLESVNAAFVDIKHLSRPEELRCIFRIAGKDYTALSAICQKRGDLLKVRKKTGIRTFRKKILARPVLLIGSLLLALFILFLPTRVLFVRAEGNIRIPEKQILEAAESCGIRFGASRKDVRSEKTKNALLSGIPELQWAGVNTYGCVAVISVRERESGIVQAENIPTASLIAERDGYILSCTATRGTLLVQPGQSVQKDQILISGYTDCGTCIQATCAQGEITALTNRDVAFISPVSWTRYGEVLALKHKYSLLIGKKRINLWKDSGIIPGSCGRMYLEYYITLPGGFRLPLGLCIEKYRLREQQAFLYPKDEAEVLLKYAARTELSSQMVAGKFLREIQHISCENGVYRLSGRYACMEMIGKLRQEQIGDTNG